MVSSGVLSHVALVRTDVSENFSASFIRVTRIGELGTTILDTPKKEALRSSETSVLTRATWRNIPEDTILSHRHENLKSYRLPLCSEPRNEPFKKPTKSMGSAPCWFFNNLPLKYPLSGRYYLEGNVQLHTKPNMYTICSTSYTNPQNQFHDCNFQIEQS
jgi:hypothetical protein